VDIPLHFHRDPMDFPMNVPMNMPRFCYGCSYIYILYIYIYIPEDSYGHSYRSTIACNISWGMQHTYNTMKRHTILCCVCMHKGCSWVLLWMICIGIRIYIYIYIYIPKDSLGYSQWLLWIFPYRFPMDTPMNSTLHTSLNMSVKFLGLLWTFQSHSYEYSQLYAYG